MRRSLCALIPVLALALAAPAASAGKIVFGDVPCNELFACLTIWVAEDDGTGARQLPVTDAFYPTWSPDGTRVAYEYGNTLRSVGADGSGDRLILDPGDSYAGAPDWSPTDDLIAFPFADHSGPGWGGGMFGSLYENDIYVIRSDGSGMRKVVGGPGGEDSVRFTADGKRLEYYRGTNPFLPDGPEPGSYSIALDGSGERRLTFGEGVSQPTPSPDGRYLAFVRKGIVWTVDARGRHARSWTAPGGSSDGPLRWSPDGPKLFFLSSPERHPPYSSRPVYVADLSRPDVPARPVTPVGRSAVFLDWTGGPAPARPADVTPPAVMLFGPASTAAAAASTQHVRVLSKRHSELFAFDMTGIRRVQVAIARCVRRDGARRCRFLGAEGFGRLRRCSPPLFRTLESGAAFSERLGTLRRGRYLMAFRTRDVADNKQLRPRLLPVALRP